MITMKKNNINIAETLRNMFMSYKMCLIKNIEIRNKKPLEQSNSENNNINSGMNNEPTISTTERTRNNNSHENIFDTRIKNQKQTLDNKYLNKLLFQKLEIKQYRDYIYYIQKIFNKIHGDYIKVLVRNKELKDFNNQNYVNEIKQLENLIARYSVVIFFLIKYKYLSLAKNIFLLMLKENKIYMTFFYENIFKHLFHIENNVKIINHFIPKSIISLTKIFSFILKYSLLFNLANTKNIYLSRYLSLQKINYNLFLLKNEFRGNLIEADTGIKYLYANCLLNSCYYSIMFFSSMAIPIKLCELIFKIYEGMNEVIFDKKEKSLLLKTTFDYSLFLYVNGSNDLALGQLQLIKSKLINYYDENFCSDDEDIDKKVIDNFETKKKKRNEEDDRLTVTRKESKKKSSISFKDKILVKKEEAMKKMERQRGLSRTENTIDKIKDILFNRRRSLLNFNENNSFDPIREANINKINNKTVKKRILRIEDIKKIFISDIKTVLNKRNRKSSITERDIKYTQKLQKNFGVLNGKINENARQSLIDLRTSHTNFRSLYKINKLNVPKYMTDYLLIETELLMCEIELDSQHIKEAYEHFKNSILILFIYKQQEDQNDVKNIRYFRKKLRIISAFLKEITKYIKEKNQKNKFQVLNQPIKSSKTYVSQQKKSFFKEKSRAKKSSVYLGRNNLLECMDVNISKTVAKKGDDYYNQLINKKLAEEIQKFFLFLNSLSIYQLKLLNDTQPKIEIRDDLPILFNGQFKDTLTTGQRNALRNLHTMSISRNMILNNTDNLILPTNLKFSVLNYNDTSNNNKSNNNYKKKKSTKKFKKNKIRSKTMSLVNTVEYEYFKKIIFSKKIKKNLQQFFLDNYSLVMKILKESRKNEINDIINNPEILVAPINNYRKNKSDYINIINNCIIYYKEIKDLRKLIYELSEYSDEENNENDNEKESSDNTDITNEINGESEFNKSISLYLSNNNSSFYSSED